MPLYEYECLKCGGRFEEIQKFSDEPFKEHPGCGGKVKKLLSAPAIQFKGTGWYVTDYGRAGQKDGEEKEKKADSGEKKAKGDGDKSAAKSSKDSDSSSSSKAQSSTTESTKK